MTQLTTLLQRHQSEFSPILPPELQFGRHLILDLSENTTQFKNANWNDPQALYEQTQKLMAEENAAIAIGSYNEDRIAYNTREHFSETKNRTVHLGLDITVPPGTPLMAPLNATIHSFKDNRASGDYGPTIVLTHELDGITFFTLYGHLSRESLNHIDPDQIVQKGERFATVGTLHENGGWPPHVHIQVIDNMEDYQGDFPGVIQKSLQAVYSERCPDPNLLLQIELP